MDLNKKNILRTHYAILDIKNIKLIINNTQSTEKNNIYMEN